MRRRGAAALRDKTTEASSAVGSWVINRALPLLDEGAHRVLRSLKRLWYRHVWQINYFRLHACYIIGVGLFGGTLLYLIELANATSLAYIDALFLAVSAVTCTGLETVDFSQISITGQVFVFLYIFSGGFVILSLAPVSVRIFVIWRRCRGVVDPSSLLEYRALCKVLKLVILYMTVWQSAVFLALVFYISFDPAARNTIVNNDVNGPFWAIFHTVSAFNNAGFSIFTDNLVQWSTTPYVIIWISVTILVGNVASSLLLRFVIWGLSFLSSKSEKPVYQFLLSHPRKCYTNLFPPSETRWLMITLLLFTLSQFVVFTAVEWNKPLLDGLPTGDKLENAMFSSITTRHAGFNTLNYSLIQPATGVLIVVMMYVGISPVTVALRNSDTQNALFDVEYDISGTPVLSTVKHTRHHMELQLLPRESEDSSSSSEEEEEDAGQPTETSPKTEDTEQETPQKDSEPKADEVAIPTVGYQARRLLTTNVAYLCIIIWVIALVEGDSLLHDPGFSMFNLVFEVVSAYGNVGLSVGYPNAPYSFCGAFHSFSKFCIILVMLMGKHRYLPNSIDRAVQLPNRLPEPVKPADGDDAHEDESSDLPDDKEQKDSAGDSHEDDQENENHLHVEMYTETSETDSDNEEEELDGDDEVPATQMSTVWYDFWRWGKGLAKQKEEI